MLQKSAPDDRRILNFPAVRPCESTSVLTLLASLIDISLSILDFKYKSFPTQKRLAREFIRQVEILLIFFEEIRDSSSLCFSTSLHLCLLELHFVLQNVQFLLYDCLRQGSRLFILMKSQFVVDRSRMLIRSVATALDIVQLDSIGRISEEVKELVELLNKQTRKRKPNIDANDECVMRLVNDVLNEFENCFEPERGVVKQILEYLRIRTWGDCNKEVKFIEEEMSSESEESRETPFLSSLLGFLCYCRGVIFDTMNETESEQSEARSAGSVISFLNPEDFRCPISLELMTDPVTISTGQTYDRLSIQKWFRAGHLLCPKTGKKLKSTELVPNLALKKLIHNFCLDNGVSMSKSVEKSRDSSKKVISPSPASNEAIKFLAQFLAGRLSYGTHEQTSKAAYEIRLLAKSNAHNRLVFVKMGNIPPLLDLLTSQDSDTQENAMAAVLKLSKHTKGQKAIVSGGGLMLIISVLRRGLKMESRQRAAATIFYISAFDKYRRVIGSTRDAIPALVELIRAGTICGKKNALTAIFALLLYHGNHERVLEAGIVPLLVDLVGKTERSDLLSDSLAVLAFVADKIDGSIAILQTPALPLVMELLKSSVGPSGKEYCLSILLSLCINGGSEVIGFLAKESSLMPSLYSLITEGSVHASKKAVKLINMLQKFQESSSSSLAAASAIRKNRSAQVL